MKEKEKLLGFQSSGLEGVVSREQYRAFDVVICLGNPYTQGLTFRSVRV